MTKTLKYLALAVLCTFVGATATSVAAQTGPGYAALVGSGLIKNNSVRSVDVKNGSLKKRDLNKKLYDRLLNDDNVVLDEDGNVIVNAPRGAQGEKGDTGATGPQGPAGSTGVTGLESDGPYPGATELVEGDNSTSYWNDSGLQRSWVRCPGNKVALGGGFTLAADASLQDKLDTHITTSAPVQIEGGNPDTYDPIAGDADGSFRPNGWLVEGATDSLNTNLIVRPHVVCANVG